MVNFESEQLFDVNFCVCLFGRDWDTVIPPGFFFKICFIPSPGRGHAHEQMGRIGAMAHGVREFACARHVVGAWSRLAEGRGFDVENAVVLERGGVEPFLGF